MFYGAYEKVCSEITRYFLLDLSIGGFFIDHKQRLCKFQANYFNLYWKISENFKTILWRENCRANWRANCRENDTKLGSPSVPCQIRALESNYNRWVFKEYRLVAYGGNDEQLHLWSFFFPSLLLNINILISSLL